MNTLNALFALCFLAAPPQSAADYRTWTDTTGAFTRTAHLEAIEGSKATLVTPDGKTLTIPLAKLSKADRKAIHEMLLANKRAEHVVWNTRAVGVRAITKSTQGFSTGMNSDGTPEYHPVHNSYDTTEKYYYRQVFEGRVVSVAGNYVTINVGGRPMTFKASNLDGASQKFLAEYRKIEKQAP